MPRKKKPQKPKWLGQWEKNVYAPRLKRNLLALVADEDLKEAKEFLEEIPPIFMSLIHVYRITLPPMAEETREEQKEAREWEEARMEAIALRSDFRERS